MPNAIKYALAVSLVVGLFGMPVRAQAAGQGGITVSPATLTLNLAPDSTQQSGGFTLTNRYAQAVTLHFGFEQRVDALNDDDPSAYLSLSYTDVTIAPGESTSQTITLHDNTKLGPGSQLSDLVITQFGDGSGNVSVRPSIRMPLVIVKQDGAVGAITLASLGSGRFSVMLPGSLSATIHNTGNMVAIPRGVITITAPDGAVVSRGVLNISSQAVSPNGKLALATPLTKLANAWLPGVYRTTISYGLGGGQAATVASRRFVYVAWWHVLALVLVGLTAYAAHRFLPRRPHKQLPTHRPPKKRPVLIGGRA